MGRDRLALWVKNADINEYCKTQSKEKVLLVKYLKSMIIKWLSLSSAFLMNNTG